MCVNDHGLPPAIPATKAKYQLKLAPSSNHVLVNELPVKKLQAVVGSEIAKFAIKIPRQPLLIPEMMLASLADHSMATNDFFRIKGEIGVSGIIWIPCLYSVTSPK